MLIHTGDIYEISKPGCILYESLNKCSTEEIVNLVDYPLDSLMIMNDCKCEAQCWCSLTQGSNVELPKEIPKENIRIHLKLFVSEETTQQEILDAVSAVRAQFPDIAPISTLILATPSASEEEIHKFWPWLKDLAQDGIVSELGVSDIEYPALQTLIENSEIKPKRVQLKFSCNTPSSTSLDLVKLANFYKIRVTIHRDDFSLNSAGRQKWVLKYTVMDSKRKVILNEGYYIEYKDEKISNCNGKIVNGKVVIVQDGCTSSCTEIETAG